MHAVLAPLFRESINKLKMNETYTQRKEETTQKFLVFLFTSVARLTDPDHCRLYDETTHLFVNMIVW